jgi:hypothetical protein
MRWLIARYQPVSLFSLKLGEATSTGGKSLLVPTPFAIRTALLDVSIRVRGIAGAVEAFQHIKALRLAIRPPQRATVTNLFVRVLKPERHPEKRGRAMQPTIAFREYVHLEGTLGLALGGERSHLQHVAALLPHISYLGKRGSFFQLLAPPETIETPETEPPADFTTLVAWNQVDKRHTGPITFPLGCIQRLDDWGPDLTFDRVNIYNRGRRYRIRHGRDRVRFDVILPYRPVRSGRGFTLYERTD